MSTYGYTRRNFLERMGLGAAAIATPGFMGDSPSPRAFCDSRNGGKTELRAAERSVRAKKSKPASRLAGKPNLLFIWTDEQRADTMAVYGNTKIHAPNLNKLASESVVFEKTYVTQPVCTPNRSAVMTGLWPHTSGCIANNIPLPGDIRCMPELVNDPDYRTAYMGKWHLGDEIFAQHGFEEWVAIEDTYTKYYGKERDRSGRSHYHHFLIEHGYKPDSSNKFSRNFAARRPIEHCKPKFLELRACDFLRRHRNEPFILYVNFLEPHPPYFGPLDKEHDPDKVDLPANFSDPLEENEPLRYRLKREDNIEKYGEDAESIRKLIAKYWGLVTQVDLSVGAILKTLDDLGLAEDTIVVYTSDHGDMMGAHNMVGKTVMYEESARIPWLIRVPNMRRTAHVISNVVSHIDMVPTVLELMGSKSNENLPGQSLVPLIKGSKVAQDHVFIEWNTPKAGVIEDEPPGGDVKVKESGTRLASKEELHRVQHERTRAVVSPDGWKLCLSDVDKCQLFNLNKDPGETTNLFDSGQHKEIISRLTKKIHQWQETVGDTVKVSQNQDTRPKTQDTRLQTPEHLSLGCLWFKAERLPGLPHDVRPWGHRLHISLRYSDLHKS